MKVALVSNIPHYHHLAQALDAAGMLAIYVTSPSPLGDEPAPALLPDYWRRKFEGRRLTGVARARVRRLWLPEALQKALPRLGLVSPERADWLNNHLFDRMAVRWVEDSEVVHFVSSVGLYCARAARRRGAKVICDSRQEHPAFLSRILTEEATRWGYRLEIPGKTYERKVLAEFACADYFFLPSRFAARTFIDQGAAPERIYVLPYGVDLERFHPKEEAGLRNQLLFVGQLTPRKGIAYLLEAWRQLRLSNVELLLIGSVDPVIRPTLARHEGAFRHLGALPKLELRQYYSSALALVLPSLADAFPLVVLEAMACGCPAIVSENTGSAEVIEDGVNGFVVPIRDVEALADRILRLQRDPELRRRMGLEAEKTARRYTWENYGRRAVEFYRRLGANLPGQDTLGVTCSRP